MTILKKNKKIIIVDEMDDISDLLMEPGWQLTRFEQIKPKNKTITLRMSEELLKEVKAKAEKLGIDYQKFIRVVLEGAVRE